MNPEATKTRHHQWVEMKVTAVDVIDGIVVPIGKEPQITVGCFACNMGMDEGQATECPGQDLFEEGGE